MNSSRLPAKYLSFSAVIVFALSLVASGQTASVAPRVTEAVDLDRLTTLRGNTHPMARPEFDRGAAPDSLPMLRMMMVLQRAPEQEAALRQMLDEQQMKSSPHYHQWLTPEEFGRQFGPAEADVQATSDWLTSQGFQVNRVSAGRTIIEFSGTAGQVRQALHTEIHKYAVNGVERWANASDPRIPAALSAVVSGIVSLNNFPRKTHARHLGTFSRSKATGEVRPLFTFTDSFGTNYAVGPTDFATIYNVLPLWQAGIDGSGQSIAIVADSNINIQDARDFRSAFGLPAKDPVVVLDGPDPGLTFSEGEADLDVQWAGAVAKNATVKLVVSADTETSFGADLSALYVIDNNLASVLSDSFGTCEAQLGAGGNAFYNSLWEQAAAEGITVLVASGDSGSAECDDPNTENAASQGVAVSGLASTPFNVSMGGTDFNDASNPSVYWNTASGTVNSAKSYIPEVPWNDSCAHTLTSAPGCATVKTTGQDLAAGGGGPSTVYAQPGWQTGAGTGVPNDGKRHSPDVSLFSGAGLNGNFLVYCQADVNAGSNRTSCDLDSPFLDFQGAGGTSFATPAFAGIIAMVNQKTGARQGNANYVLYPLAATNGARCDPNSPTASCIFYDVATGNISVACVGGSPNCSKATAGGFGVMVSPAGSTSLAWRATAGYDMATGLGSVNAANLVNKWASVGFSSTTTTLVSISPTTITHGSPVNVNVAVTSGGGIPTGDVTLATAANGPLGIPAFTLSNGTFNGPTNFLPGGTYSVTAHYAGDGTFGGSNSAPPGITVTVNPESSKTSLGLVTFDINTGQVLSTNATTAAYGSPYVLRGDVTNSSGQLCASAATGLLVYACPTGAITITDNGAPLDGGTFALNSQGFTEDILIQLSATPTLHPLVATYSGDKDYSAGSPLSDPITITPAVTTLTAAVIGLPVQYGQRQEVGANLNTSSNGAAPTGTFTFSVDGTQVGGPVSIYESGTYNPYSSPPTYAWADPISTIVFQSVGNHTLSAQYSGDANYQPASSPPITVSVTKASISFANFGANPWPAVVGQQETLTTQMFTYGEGATPTGTITFSDGSSALSGTVTYTPSSNGLAAALPYIFTAGGLHNMTVTYSGDSNYLPTNASFPVTVSAPDFSLPASSPGISISAPGQSGSSMITLSALSGFTAIGTVKLTCAIPASMAEATCALNPASLSTSGTSTLTVTTTASHTVGNLFNVFDNWFGGGKGVFLFFTLVFALALMGRKRRLAYGMLLFAVIAVGSNGCGGSSSSPPLPVTDPGTVPGAYTVTVTANNGSFTHTSSVLVNLH